MRLMIPPPIQLIVTGAAMWGLDRLFPALRVVFDGQKTTASFLIVIGLAIEILAVAQFIRHRTTINPLNPDGTSTLVTDGLYRLSRNPMYAGMLILLIGWLIRLENAINILPLLGFILTMTVLQIRPEERAMRQKFGSEYEAYCARVPRWIGIRRARA